MTEGEDLQAGTIDVWFEYTCKLISLQETGLWAFGHRISPWSLQIRGDWRGSLAEGQTYQLQTNQGQLVVEGAGTWTKDGEQLCLEWDSSTAEELQQWIQAEIIPNLEQQCAKSHCSLTKLFALWRWYALTDASQALLASIATHTSGEHPRIAAVAMAAALCRLLSEQAEEEVLQNMWRAQAAEQLAHCDPQQDHAWPLCLWVRQWLAQTSALAMPTIQPVAAAMPVVASASSLERSQSIEPTMPHAPPLAVIAPPSMAPKLGSTAEQAWLRQQWQQLEGLQLQLERQMQQSFAQQQQAQRRWQQATARMVDGEHWHRLYAHQSKLLQQELNAMLLATQRQQQQGQQLANLEQYYLQQCSMLQQAQQDADVRQVAYLQKQQQLAALQAQQDAQAMQASAQAERLQTAQQQIAQMEQALQQKQTQVAKLTESEQIHQQEKIALAHQIQQIQAFAAAEKNQWQATNETLRQQFHTWKQQCQQLAQQNQSLQQQVASNAAVEQTYQQLKSSYDALQNQFSTSQAQAQQEQQHLQDQVATLEQELHRLQQQSSQTASQTQQTLQQQQQVLLIEKQQLGQQLAASVGQLEQLQTQLAKEQQLVVEQQQQQDRLEKQLQQAQQQAQQEQLRLQEEVNQWQARYQQEQDNRLPAESATSQMRAEKEQLTAALTQSQHKIATLEQANQTLQQQWFSTQAALEQEALRRQASDEQLASLRLIMQRSSSPNQAKTAPNTQPQERANSPSNVQISGKIAVSPPPLPPKTTAKPPVLFEDHELTTIVALPTEQPKKSV